MDLGKIYRYQEELRNEEIDTLAISEIQAAFDELVASGVELRDEPENALAGDMLDELQANVTPVELAIYEWIAENYGETEANEPAYSTYELAKKINGLQVILGVDDATIGKMVQEQ